MSGVYEIIEKIGRFAVPYIIIYILFILNVIFIPASEGGIGNIALVMMAIYYWSIYRPTLLPPFLVFVIGVCFDAISGWPIGLSSLIFLIVRQSVSGQRLFLTGQPFPIVWLGFSGALAIAILTQWGIFSLINFQALPIISLGTSWLVSVFMFPLISLALNLSHKLLPELQDQYSAVG